MQVSRYPQNTDGTPMNLLTAVLVDSTGNSGARLTNPPLGPDRAPIDAVGLVLVDPTGAAYPVNVLGMVSSLAELAGATNTSPRHLNLGGRSGLFVYNSANLTAAVTADTLQGIYVAPTSTPSGAAGAWVRVWDSINGKPEWFGASVNDNAADNRGAILACVANCPVTLFSSVDYYITGRLNVNTGYRALLGPFNPDGYNTGNGPRIISTLTSADVCRAGPSGAPATTNDFLRNLVIRNLCFMHVGARTLPGVGSEKNGVAGLRCEYLIDCTISDNYANEPIVGFTYLGVIGSVLYRNRAFRSALFGGNDIFIGHLFWGNALNTFGLIGNNASYFGDKWNATVQGAALGLAAANRIGVWFDGALSDGFNNDLETLGCGLRITGLGISDTSTGNGDFRIQNPVIDQHDGVPIEISGINKTGHIRIVNPYAGAPAANTYIMRVRDSAGAVTVQGGDLYGTAGTNTTVGINVENSTGMVMVDGTVIHECGKPATVVASTNFIMEPRIVNWNNTSSAPQGAVALVNSQRGRVQPQVVGKAGSYPQGIITLDALCSNIVFDPTGVDIGAITGGAANKLIINAVSITAPGYYTAAGGAASSGAGNQVTGITV